jgi:hypothetical protein
MGVFGCSSIRGVCNADIGCGATTLPDPMSETMAESWRTGPAKALERQNAALVAAEPAGHKATATGEDGMRLQHGQKLAGTACGPGQAVVTTRRRESND